MIRESKKPIRVLAKELGITPKTVWRWKLREDPEDASCRPKRIRTVWEGWEVEDFAREAVRFFPFRGRKVLTDNGKEFLSEAFGVYLESEHRRTRAYSPWTNGMAERWIGRVSEVLREVRVEDHEKLKRVRGIFWLDYLVYRRQRVLGSKTPF